MKSVILVLAMFLLPLNVLAIEPDKRMHLEFSFFLGAAFYSVYEVYRPKREAYVLSILTVLAIGGAKELLYDDRPDIEDMRYNLIGAMAGPIFPIILTSF